MIIVNTKINRSNVLSIFNYFVTSNKNPFAMRMVFLNKQNHLITELKSVFIFANNLFLETMGYAANEKSKVIGKHHSVFVSYEYSKSDEYIKFWESLKKGKYFDGIFERKKVDGSTVYLQASYNPVLDSKGNITDVVKIATDVTEAVNSKKKIDDLTKNLTIELENSQKLKHSIELEKNAALNDLDVMIKKSQSESVYLLFVINRFGYINSKFDYLNHVSLTIKHRIVCCL